VKLLRHEKQWYRRQWEFSFPVFTQALGKRLASYKNNSHAFFEFSLVIIRNKEKIS